MINRVHLSHLPWIKIRWSQISAIYNDYKFKFFLRNFKRPCYRKWLFFVLKAMYVSLLCQDFFLCLVKCPLLHCKLRYVHCTAGNRHKQNSRFCKEIREDNFRFWWRRRFARYVHVKNWNLLFYCSNIAKSENA
jgi:hypothetical protein